MFHLEIVVPTFNRADILALSLKELTAAVATQLDKLSLRVVDNCSTDHTFAIVQPFLEKGLLCYERNDENIGLMKNIVKCIETSSSEWVWVLGDDDHLLLHSLPFLCAALAALPEDVVFARGLSAKLSSRGELIHFEKGQYHHSTLNYKIYDPGIEIAANGSIHSLAFISQLLIRPNLWDKRYHDSIYKDTDLYSFVLTMLAQCKTRKSADLDLHVVVATDRGDRSYYTPNMCIARVTEYTAYEIMVHQAVGRRRATTLLARGRKGLLPHRIASCFKLVAYRDSYRINDQDPVEYLRSYKTPYFLDRVVIRALASLAMLPGSTGCFRYVYDHLKSKFAH